MVLVDSTVWINHLRGQVSEKTGKLRSLLADGDVVCTWIMAQEILQVQWTRKNWKYCVTTLFLCHKFLPASNPCQRKCLVCPLPMEGDHYS